MLSRRRCLSLSHIKSNHQRIVCTCVCIYLDVACIQEHVESAPAGRARPFCQQRTPRQLFLAIRQPRAAFSPQRSTIAECTRTRTQDTRHNTRTMHVTCQSCHCGCHNAISKRSVARTVQAVCSPSSTVCAQAWMNRYPYLRYLRAKGSHLVLKKCTFRGTRLVLQLNRLKPFQCHLACVRVFSRYWCILVAHTLYTHLVRDDAVSLIPASRRRRHRAFPGAFWSGESGPECCFRRARAELAALPSP